MTFATPATARRCLLLTSRDFLSFEYSGNAVGVMQELTVFSRALGRRADISVYVPSSVDPEEPTPLVVLLHGVYGSHWSWSRLGQAPSVTEALVREGAIRGCIIAMPSDGLLGLGSGYVANGTEDAERWIAEEVPVAVQRLYSGAGEGGVSIAGLSMGGLGALNLMANHIGLYSAAAALSPLIDGGAIGRFTGHPQYGPNASSVTTDRLVAGLSALRGSGRRLWLGCGLEDSLLESSRSLHARLGAADIEHSYIEASGGHEWSYWTAQLPQVLVFFDSLHP